MSQRLSSLQSARQILPKYFITHYKIDIPRLLENICLDCTASRISSRLRDFFKAEFQSGLPKRDAIWMKYINLNPRITARRIGGESGRRRGRIRSFGGANTFLTRYLIGRRLLLARINSPKTMRRPDRTPSFLPPGAVYHARRRSGSAGKNVRRRARSSTLYFHVIIAEILDRSLAWKL